MGNSALEDVLAAGDFLAKEMPTRLLYGRLFEEFPDDEVPLCDQCGKLCEWVYFSSPALKKLRGAPVHWCGGCLARARVRDGAPQWKAHVRMGLHDHLLAVKRLKPQEPGPNPHAARSPVVKADERALAGGEEAAAVFPTQMPPPPPPPPAVPLVLTTAEGAQQQQQQHGSIRLTAAKPPLPEKMSKVMAKLCEDLKTVLAEYFVRGQGEDFTTSGAEIVGRYRKHFRGSSSPQWKQVYQVLTSFGLHCELETVPSGQGAGKKQLTRVVRGLKPKTM